MSVIWETLISRRRSRRSPADAGLPQFVTDNLANYFMNLFVTSILMTFINILIVAIWKSKQVFRAYGRGNMPLQAVNLPISHNNVVRENTVLQLNILETGVLTLVVQNSSPTRLRLVGDEFWPTRVRTPVSKIFRWRTYNSKDTTRWYFYY